MQDTPDGEPSYDIALHLGIILCIIYIIIQQSVGLGGVTMGSDGTKSRWFFFFLLQLYFRLTTISTMEKDSLVRRYPGTLFWHFLVTAFIHVVTAAWEDGNGVAGLHGCDISRFNFCYYTK